MSIQTVRQEGRGDDAQLVVVSHEATDAQLRHGRALRGLTSSGRHVGDAGGRETSESRAQWRGVIEEYRDLLAIPADTPR